VAKGKVCNIADFGIFVAIEEGIDGLVHIERHELCAKHPRL
jgi:predicted RNA-binding protein with RPS1 domain